MIHWNYKVSLLLALLLAILQSNAQEKNKLGFDLIFHLDTVEENTIVPLLVEGQNDVVKKLVHTYEGSIQLEINNLFSIEIPAKHVKSLANSSNYIKIEYNNYYPRSLADTMLIQTNMDSVIRMMSPIRTNFSGKGVLLGVIDSGIELDHPDFQDSLGNTRILYIWDQAVAYNPSRKPGKYNYGVEWDSASINQNIASHDDRASEFGHGSMVTGAAASNANASGNFRGIAPEVSIISVATDFSRNNWLQSVAEAVDYIYNKADSLGMSCVINASIGTYVGSHDGKDIAARMIDQMIKSKSGRAFVCAAGNAGSFNFHLQHDLQNDTNFSWFEYSPNLFSNQGGVYFEAWADTNDLKNMHFSIGADNVSSNSYSFRGRTSFDSIINRLNVVHLDSIMSPNQNKLAEVLSYAELSQGRYRLTFAIINPDSSQYRYRLETRGTGKLDIWSNYNLTRTSNIKLNNLPSASSFPEMRKYKRADSLQTIVSSFTCLPSVITVGNYINRNTYLDVNNNLQSMGATPGESSINSSLGPNRNGYLKPDISSSGDFMLSAGRIATMNTTINTQPSKISVDSLHMRNGGTSMASPTVAGMLCLYLQQCSKADYNQMKNSLLNSAKKDLFTGSQNNPKWGNGKADAFQLLSSNAFQASISASSFPYCNGDSVQLTIANIYSNYSWNNGDTNHSIFVSYSGQYFAMVENQNYCTSITDTLNIVFQAIPSKPNLSLSNDSLIGDLSGNYNWYLNGNLINGVNDSILKMVQAGNYHAVFTDSSGCSIHTDTVNYIITSLNENKSKAAAIYPNPNSGNFTLDAKESISELRIRNIAGKIIYEKTAISKQLIDIQMGPLRKGIYFLEIEYQSKKLEFYKLVINS